MDHRADRHRRLVDIARAFEREHKVACITLTPASESLWVYCAIGARVHAEHWAVRIDSMTLTVRATCVYVGALSFSQQAIHDIIAGDAGMGMVLYGRCPCAACGG